MKPRKPQNQKASYATMGEIIEGILNKDISVAEAEQIINATAQMNRIYGLELKRKELTGDALRIIEIKPFDETA